MTTQETNRLNPEAMQARIEDLAKRGELSADELKEFVYLIYRKILIDEGDEGFKYDRYLYLPSCDNPTVLILVGDPNEEKPWVDITIDDGLKGDDAHYISGERIVMGEKEGKLQWNIGVYESAYSDFLGRKILLDTGDLSDVVKAIDPLTPEEHAKVAKTIYEPYMESLNPPQNPVA